MNDEYVEVTVTSSTTWRTGLNALYNAANQSKITKHSVVASNGAFFNFAQTNVYNRYYVDTMQLVAQTLWLSPTGSACYMQGTSSGHSDNTNTAIGYNGVLRLYYK